MEYVLGGIITLVIIIFLFLIYAAGYQHGTAEKKKNAKS